MAELTSKARDEGEIPGSERRVSHLLFGNDSFPFFVLFGIDLYDICLYDYYLYSRLLELFHGGKFELHKAFGTG